MKTKGKIITRIGLAVAIMVLCLFVILFVLPLNTPGDKLNLSIGTVAAVAILTVFSILAIIQEDKKPKNL
jgi:hypothetical protein